MNKIVGIGRFVVRNFLQLTPVGRNYYVRRKQAQKEECSRNLQLNGSEILRKVHDAFTVAGYAYYVCDGTLLGIIREGRILKNDIDIDFTVPPGATTPLQVLDLVSNLGFEFFWAWSYEGKIANMAFQYKDVHIDFDFLLPENNGWSQLLFTKLEGVKYPDNRRWSVLARSMPVVTRITNRYVEAYGFEVSVPENTDEYLTASYGNWRVPDSTWREKNLTKVSSTWIKKQSDGIRVKRDEIKEFC